MDVLMITGSYPPAVCGVGDYTMNVLSSKVASDWRLYHRTDWRFSKLLTIIHEINTFNAERIFIQYPTQGYGWSIVPHLLCVYYSLIRKVNCTLVLHEYSQLSVKARIAVKLMLLTATNIIVTNEFERTEVARVSKSVSRRSKVVKIVSNIPVSKNILKTNLRKYDLAYFGHIRPKKGIEDYLDVAAKIRFMHPNCSLLLIGQIPPGFEDYSQKIIEQCLYLKIETKQNLNAEVVADLLAQVKVTYLPFPDGISERRGTALAALANGSIVLTTTGPHTTSELRDAVCIVSSDNVMREIEQLLVSSEQRHTGLQCKGKAYLNELTPATWDSIACDYLK
jgi:glycosyltransferase involved in cell wall biosynthesis